MSETNLEERISSIVALQEEMEKSSASESEKHAQDVI